MFSALINEVLRRPLLNMLVFLYNTVSFHDLGVAIIILTLLIRFLLGPLSRKAIVSQKEMMAIHPHVRKLQEKHKHDKAEQSKKVMELYKEKNVNPLSGCLPLLIQLPIIIILYRVLFTVFSDQSIADQLYGFVRDPGPMNHLFLGFIDISNKNLFLAVAAGALQFLQSKMILDEQKKHNTPEDFKKNSSLAMSQQMTYMMPVVTVLITYSVHAGIALYWVTTTLFSVVQQWLVFKKKK